MKTRQFLEILLQDVRYAGRMLRRSPGFSATAISALALGIGANTAIFTVVNTVLLQPLAYPEPDRLVQLELSSPQGNGNITSIPKFIIWREQTQVFQDVAAYDLGGPGVNLTGGDRPEQLKGVHVSAEFFRLFGARVVAGRTFSAEEDRPGGPPLAVIAGGLWRRRFGSDLNLVGKSIDLGGEPFTVIGILDPTFTSDPPADIYLPLKADPNSTDQAHYLRAAARLKPGVTLEKAKAAMKVAAEQFNRKFAAAAGAQLGPQGSFTAEPLRDTIVGDVRKALLVLLGAVSLVLLIACANVANLLLARATIRRREIAIRAAIGAGRGRLIRQLLTESVLLSLAGGLLGLGLGYFGVRGLLSINPGNIPRIGEQGSGITLDWRVLAFTLGVSVFTGVLFGLIPAFNASRTDLNATLKESGLRAGSGLRQNKARSILVVTEMALALVLLVGAALLIRTFGALRSVDPGFDARNVLTMQMSLTGTRFNKAAGVNQLVREVQRRAESLPGVTALASTCCLPLEGGFGLPLTIEGRPLTDGPFHGGASWHPVSPRYFQVFKIPLVHGRMLTDRDDGGAVPVVLINEGLAKQFWPNSDAVGQRITIGKGIGPEFAEAPREIVGIVGDVRGQGLNNNPDPIMYVPVAQVTDGVTALNNGIIPITWTIRTNVEPYSVSKEIQEALRTASGGLPVAHIRSMEQVRGESTSRTDFNMTLLVIFASLALLLAAIGIYGLMAYSVQQRTQEIGIRMALGASAQDVRKMVVRQGMALALAGVIIGVAAALGVTRLMASLLYGVTPRDPIAMTSVALLLVGVALAATYLPARRASQMDPVESLRYE
jgi:putative ABC transport system permease protein